MHGTSFDGNALPCPTACHVRGCSIDAAGVEEQSAHDVGQEAGEVAEGAVRGAAATGRTWSDE
jgi:hypothetical protein